MGISSPIIINTFPSHLPLTFMACSGPTHGIQRLVLTISFASLLYLMFVKILGILNFHSHLVAAVFGSHIVASQYAPFENINARFLGKQPFVFFHFEPKESKLLTFQLERREHEKYA